MSKKKANRVEWDRTEAMARLLGVPADRLSPARYLTANDILAGIMLMLSSFEAERIVIASECYLEIASDLEAVIRTEATRLTPILAGIPAGGQSYVFGVPVHRTEPCWRRCTRCVRPFNVSCRRCVLVAPTMRLVGPRRWLPEVPDGLEMQGDLSGEGWPGLMDGA